MNTQERTGKGSTASPSFAHNEQQGSIPHILRSETESMSANTSQIFEPVIAYTFPFDREISPRSSHFCYSHGSSGQEATSPTTFPSLVHRSTSPSPDRNSPPPLSHNSDSSDASTALPSPDETEPSLALVPSRHARGSNGSGSGNSADHKRSFADLEHGHTIVELQDPAGQHPLGTSSYMLHSTMAAMHADLSKDSASSILAASRAALAARTTSIDINMGHDSGASRNALDKLSRRKSVAVQRAKESSSISEKLSHPAWRERKPEARKFLKIARKNRTVLTGGLFVITAGMLYVLGFFSPTGSGLLGGRGVQLFGTACNPYSVPGNLQIDYAEPSNNYWDPKQSKGGKCSAPRYMQKLRAGDTEGMNWMNGRTVVLIGDSIERDHVTQFCNLLGREAETAKGSHKYAIKEEAKEPESNSKKDRYRRLAIKGMQESTLPRVCYIPELDFLVTSLYQFGLDDSDYWKTLDQYHGPSGIEERFPNQIEPYLELLDNDGRGRPDLVEINSGMFDLARWAQQDIAAGRSTEDLLSEDRLSWYRARVRKFMALTAASFPEAIKLWRGVTLPEEQSAELDYFNDSFGHTPANVKPYFSLNRIQQIDQVVRKLADPYTPTSKSANDVRHTRRDKVERFVYNTWSSVIRGVPAHQLDRLHGGDLATPGAVIWSDIMLWHLKQSVKSKTPA